MLTPIEFEIAKPIKFIPLTRECTPKILVYIDGSSYGSFTEFLDAIENTTIHGMTPIVETASMQNTGTADHKGFVFTPANFNKRKYDVLFLFGFSSGTLPGPEREVISQFMEDGGGVFATGDHATIGKRIGNDLPRVRSMRYWDANTPTASGADRLTTDNPGVDFIYGPPDQSDAIPQRLYPKYYGPLPHYLLQHPDPAKRIIEVFPDHPHEGECVEPTSLTGTFEIDGQTFPEFPQVSGTPRPEPEIIAKSMSAGGGYPGKSEVTPREFGAICVYDGHEADVGRVVTDSTWHHFHNLNVAPLNPDAKGKVKTYFRNIAEWLMPENVRRCSIFHFIDWAIKHYPLNEFIPLHISKDPVRVPALERNLELGQAFIETMEKRMSPAALSQLIEDMETFSGGKTLKSMRKSRFDRKRPILQPMIESEEMCSKATLGAAIHNVAQELEEMGSVEAFIEKRGGELKALATLKKPINSTIKNFKEELSKAVEFEIGRLR